MIKNKQKRKIIAVFLTLNFLSTLLPFNMLYASNNGPNAPEASSFEPVSATDMVNLSSGDMAYVLPLLDIDGFPVSLSYHAGIPMDMESSWVGLGWNINTGAISRGVVATPDDWKEGKKLDLTFLRGFTEDYSVDIGVGIKHAAEVGIGLSWGPNKALSGSVSAGVGPISISADTNGGVGVSLNPFGRFKGAFSKIGEGPMSNSPFGGSLSYSNKGGFSANAGVTGSYKGMKAGMGISVSGQGVGGSFSIGYGKNMNTKSARGGAGSISMSSFSAGDFSFNSKGFYIPLTIGVLSFGFGYRKTEIKLEQANNKNAYGTLYHNQSSLYQNNNYSSWSTIESSPDPVFRDYQKRNYFGDAYEQVIPQSEADFIADYRQQVEKLNFTFAGYDSYSINASGVGGALRPIIGQNSVLMGEGYDGNSSSEGNKKTKVFYHNSNNTMRTTRSIADNNLHFVFDGQITEDEKMSGSGFINSTGSSNMHIGRFVNRGSTIDGRPRAGSYVEVFTNGQIDAGSNILHPSASYSILPSNSNPNGSKDSRAVLGYQAEGIGAYRITTPDGKTYHFSQPVYQYEQIQHNYMNFKDVQDPDPHNSQSKREATPYATHWLLTAITGPDFIDDGDNFPDDGDLGYWVRLDHGHWSSAYAWRSPHDDKLLTDRTARRHYSTFIDDEVEKSDPGYFIQGRKDLYYLDKIVSKDQVAHFVKDIRYDGLGTSADYIYTPSGAVYFDDKLISGSNDTYAHEYIKYDREYQLKLDKIVITKNENQVSTNSSQTSFRGLTAVVKDGRYRSSGLIYNELGSGASKHKLHQSKNVIDTDDFQSFDYSKASKVIKFNDGVSNANQYKLAPQTPSSNHSSNQSKGRLTLNNVKFYGRGTVMGASENQLYDYMPAYTFDYEKATLPYSENQVQQVTRPIGPFGQNITYYEYKRAKKDNWGFRNEKIDTNGDDIEENTIDAWSLNKITTPQGSTIEITYEEDDFKVEAFARNFWKKNMMFRVYDHDSDHYRVEIINDVDNNSITHVDFSDYFRVGQKVMLDLFLCRKWKSGGSIARTRFDVNPNDYSEVIGIIPNSGSALNRLDIKVRKRSGMFESNRGIHVLNEGFYTNRTHGWYSPNGYDGPNVFKGDKPRGICPDDPGNSGDHWSMKYTLLANKVAPGTSGGGLRVKEITVRDEQNNRYVTEYNYNDPNTGRTSGITSFNPTYGEVFVPYQNELPGPGVMYEYVTMKAYGFQGSTKKLNTQKRYRYYTLQPVWDIFNPNIDMKDIDGESIFKTTVENPSMNQYKLTAKKMNIEKNLTKIGQLISVEELNEHDQILAKSVNRYSPRIGELKETFSSMKSVFNFDLDDEGNIVNHGAGQLQQRHLSLSSKSEKVSVVDSIYTYGPSGNGWVAYSDPDPYLGTFTQSEKQMADGTIVREEKIPAYKFYSQMGSKILNPSNKNMLTQEAMNISSVKIGSEWKTSHADITTWNNNWTYRSETGTETTPTATSEKVWRKHKSFVWKDGINAVTGTYNTSITDNNTYFNWGTGTPTSSKWQEVSEITRYNHWSSPQETRDINGNYASSKMADNWSKTVAAGNAKYTEMYASGAEFPIMSGSSVSRTEDEFTFNNCGISSTAHTGNNAIELRSYGRAFIISGSVTSGHNSNGKFRSGKYKVSFWQYRSFEIPRYGKSVISYSTPSLNVDGRLITPTQSVRAGDWILHNYIIDLNSSSVNMYVQGSNSGNFIIDDFRMHPIYASINTYVYDQNTGELNYLLDGINLATRFEYDKAGRLKKTFKEVLDESNSQNNGGFKLIQEYNYNYKNQ